MKSFKRPKEYTVKIVDITAEKFAKMTKKEKVIFMVSSKSLLKKKDEVIET
jgi:hypothetical protein